MLFKIDEYSKPIPAVVDADLDLMEFAGLWLADGCYDGKYGMVLSVGEEELKSVVRRVADKFGLKTRTHSDDFSTMASNTNLVWFFKNVVGLNGDAYTKKCLLGRGVQAKNKICFAKGFTRAMEAYPNMKSTYLFAQNNWLKKRRQCF